MARKPKQPYMTKEDGSPTEHGKCPFCGEKTSGKIIDQEVWGTKTVNYRYCGNCGCSYEEHFKLVFAGHKSYDTPKKKPTFEEAVTDEHAKEVIEAIFKHYTKSFAQFIKADEMEELENEAKRCGFNVVNNTSRDERNIYKSLSVDILGGDYNLCIVYAQLNIWGDYSIKEMTVFDKKSCYFLDYIPKEL